MISRTELDVLMRHRAEPCVTLTLPVEPPGVTPRRNAVQLDALVREAEDRLGAQGAGTALLDPARKLVTDEAFWLRTRQGLALFLAPGFERIVELPGPVERAVGIGARFRITGVLPYVGERRVAFYLLTASASRAALFRVDTEGMAPEPVDLPQGVAAVAASTDYEQASSSAAPADQNLGASPEDLRKGQLMQYLNKLATAVKAQVGHLPVPVLLAAQPEVAGNFRKQSEIANLWPEHLDVNPDALDFDELRRRALERMAATLEEDLAPDIDHFNSLYNDHSPRASTAPDELVRAARWGRMDTLIVGAGQHVWGVFDEQADRVETHREPAPGDDDLLDRAAVETLLNGGQVRVVEAGKVPGDGAAAGIMRY